jgi:hypothetical protein
LEAAAHGLQSSNSEDAEARVARSPGTRAVEGRFSPVGPWPRS